MFGKGGVLEAPAIERLVPPIVLPGDMCDHGECPSTVAASITLPSGLVLGFCWHHGSVCYRQMLARGLKPRPLEKVF